MQTEASASSFLQGQVSRSPPQGGGGSCHPYQKEQSNQSQERGEGEEVNVEKEMSVRVIKEREKSFCRKDPSVNGDEVI